MFGYVKGWKWRNKSEYAYALPHEFEGKAFHGTHLILEHRVLTVMEGYGWDGASGPAIDTEDFMRGSMIHDALYEIIGKKGWFKLRKAADKELVQICKEDGMPWVRRSYTYRAVRIFGGRYVKKRYEDFTR